MNLLVTRHGVTEWNERGLINGRSGDVLSTGGKGAVIKLVEELKDHKIDGVYSSPLARATQTAEPIAKDKGCDILIDDRLAEVDFGDFTGKSFESTKKAFGLNATELLDTYKYDLTEFGGESWHQVKARVQDYISDMRNSGHRQVVVVTHGGILRWFYLLCMGEQTSIPSNLSIHEFKII